MSTEKTFNTKTMVKIAMLGALAAVLMFFEFPLPITPEFYKLDFSELPVIVGAFALGPIPGVLIELIKILVKFVIKGTSTGGVGELANFIVGCAFCLPAAIMYQKDHTRKGAIKGLIAGTVVMIAVGCIINAYVLLPVYAKVFGMPMEAIIGIGQKVNPKITSLSTFVMFGVAPFNLIKGILISVITLLIYKRLSPILHS